MRFLSRFHYKPVPLDDAMSEKIFDAYLDGLDGELPVLRPVGHRRLRRRRDKLDDAIFRRDLTAPFAIFNVYQQRVAERLSWSRELLATPFDFSKDESYAYDRSKAPWAKDRAELDELWRLRVKNDWLRLSSPARPRRTSARRSTSATPTISTARASSTARRLPDVHERLMQMSIEPHTSYPARAPRRTSTSPCASRWRASAPCCSTGRIHRHPRDHSRRPGGDRRPLKAGDRVLAVGQGASGPLVDVIGWRLDDVVDKIRGAKGTVVRLEILPEAAGPDGKHETLTLTRNKVNVEEQAAKKSVIEIDQAGTTRRVGVISLPTFYQDFDARRRGAADYRSATRDVQRLLGELREERSTA